jgi:hypothetical protein
MEEETLNILNELSKKPITELAMSYMEVVVDNMVKDKEIARLNKIIDELENYLTFQIRHTDKEYIFGEVYHKLKELKEEGKE